MSVLNDSISRSDRGSFSLSEYGEIVTAFIAAGYEIRNFHDVQSDAKHLILRHDLDFDINAAVELAEVEHELGVAATYFVLLRTEFYNPFSRLSGEVIQRLKELGHNIGLHFDAALYDFRNIDARDAIDKECRILEQMVGMPVHVFSFHRPSYDDLDRVLEIPGRINAYGSRYFRRMGYCSDSRGSWHHGYPLDHPVIDTGRALQLLTHPIWWGGLSQEEPTAKLEAFLKRRTTALQQEMVVHSSVYQPAESSPDI